MKFKSALIILSSIHPVNARSQISQCARLLLLRHRGPEPSFAVVIFKSCGTFSNFLPVSKFVYFPLEWSFTQWMHCNKPETGMQTTRDCPALDSKEQLQGSGSGDLKRSSSFRWKMNFKPTVFGRTAMLRYETVADLELDINYVYLRGDTE